MRELLREILSRGRDRGEFRSDLDLDSDPVIIQRMLEACGELVAAAPDAAAEIVAASTRSVLAVVRRS